MKSGLLLLSSFSTLGLAQQLCGQFDYHNSQGWYFNNNEWGSGSGSGDQCTYIDSVDANGVSWHTDWTWSGGENNVKSYPYSGRELADKRIVSSIGSIPSVAVWRYEGGNVRANVAYDLFTAADPNHELSSGDYELMIWLARLGGVYPIGDSVGFVNIGGLDWELYVGWNGDMRVYSYIAPNEVKSFEGDIKPYFDHVTATQGFPADTQHLITLQFGTEPFTGSNARFFTDYWSGYTA